MFPPYSHWLGLKRAKQIQSKGQQEAGDPEITSAPEHPVPTQPTVAYRFKELSSSHGCIATKGQVHFSGQHY